MIKDISKNYIQIQGWMVSKLELSGNQLLTFALIYGFSQDGESKFTGSLKYLSTWLNSTKPTAMKALKCLVNKNLLIKNSNSINGVKFNSYKANLPLVNKIYQGGKDSSPGGGKDSSSGGGKDSLHNNTNIDNTNIDSKEDNSKKSSDFSKKDFKQVLLELNCDESHVNDWIKVREKKKAAQTQTALKKFIGECEKNNYPVASAVEKCAENSWSGFKYQWLINQQNQNQNGNTSNRNNTAATNNLQNIFSRIDEMYGDE